MNSNKDIKILDFGISKQFNPNLGNEFSTKKAGIINYMAPELLLDDIYNKKIVICIL